MWVWWWWWCGRASHLLRLVGKGEEGGEEGRQAEVAGLVRKTAMLGHGGG
jgi:hypothetical protein